MIKLSLVSVFALALLVGGCEPEQRQTTPSGGAPAARTGASRGGRSAGLSASQMATLRQLMSLRREAVQLTRRRKFAAALEKLRDAMVIAPTIFGARHPFSAQIASQKAFVHEEAGSWGKAAEAYDEVLALWRRALDSKVAEPLAEALRKKGVALLFGDKPARAIVVLTRALAMWHRVAKLESGRYGPYYMYITRGAPTGSIAICTMDLGEAYLRSRKLKQAEALLLRAATMTRGIQMPAQFQLQLNLDLAYVFQVYGKNDRAAGHLSKVAGVLAKAGPGMRRMQLKYLLRLADLHLIRRDFTGAERVVGRTQKLVGALKVGTGTHALHGQVVLAEVYLGTQRVRQGAALLKALAPKIAVTKKSLWLQARYHLAVVRQWLGSKRRARAWVASVKAIAVLRKLKVIRPVHAQVYEAAARSLEPRRGLIYTAVAYWVRLHLGARDQPSARRLEKALCGLKKKLGKAKANRYLIKAQAEARNAKVKSSALPACR